MWNFVRYIMLFLRKSLKMYFVILFFLFTFPPFKKNTIYYEKKNTYDGISFNA